MAVQRPRYRSVWSELYATEFRQSWVDAGGLKTRFIEAGSPSNPPLILLHGTAGSWENFALNVAAHAEHFNCYAVDFIGHGYSTKPEHPLEIPHYLDQVHRVLDALKQRAVIT